MSEDAPFRTRRDKGESNPRDLRYPPLPEPLEVGTYDNHTHFDFADGEQPLAVEAADHLREQRGAGVFGLQHLKQFRSGNEATAKDGNTLPGVFQ